MNPLPDKILSSAVFLVLQGNQMTLVFIEREYSSPEEPHLGIVHMVEVNSSAHTVTSCLSCSFSPRRPAATCPICSKRLLSWFFCIDHSRETRGGNRRREKDLAVFWPQGWFIWSCSYPFNQKQTRCRSRQIHQTLFKGTVIISAFKLHRNKITLRNLFQRSPTLVLWK